MFSCKLHERSQMSLERIIGVLIQEYYITKRSLEVILDLFFFSIMFVVVFGLFSNFLSSQFTGAASFYLLLGMLLWEVIRITQYSMSVGALWNVWSRNLSNMFIAPLSMKEYLAAQMISGVVKSALILLIISVISAVFFKFNILTIGLASLILAFINLTIFSWSVGIAILGVIFRFGQRIQALAWGLIFLFQPLTAAFFPVKILPATLQTIAFLFPPTYVFEATRGNLENIAVNWSFMTTAFLLNLIYFAASLWFFQIMYRAAKRSGQFAKLES